MYLFIDESGVHLEGDKSTIAIIYVQVSNMDVLNLAIIKVEEKLKIRTFHWSKHNWKIREQFMSSLLKENFTVKAAVVENPFTKKVLFNALEVLITERKIRTIVLDGKKPKWYSLQIKKILRDRGISVKKIVTGNDESYPCLRLADAFAGLIRAHWRDKDNINAKSLYNKSVHKITTQLVGGQTDG